MVTESLHELAARGVPSRVALKDAFAPAADAILAASRPTPEGLGLVDRLLLSAQSAVRVRPVGDVEGDTPEAIVARMEARLDEGDLDGVVAQWSGLPDAAKAASQDFIDDVSARLMAEQMVDEALSSSTGEQG